MVTLTNSGGGGSRGRERTKVLSIAYVFEGFVALLDRGGSCRPKQSPLSRFSGG